GAEPTTAPAHGRACTRSVLRMSPKALHGDPDRVRHSRLPHCRISRRRATAGSRIARRSASLHRAAANQGTLLPTGIAPEVGQIVNMPTAEKSRASHGSAGGLLNLCPAGEFESFVQGGIAAHRRGHQEAVAFGKDAFHIAGVDVRVTDNDVV